MKKVIRIIVLVLVLSMAILSGCSSSQKTGGKTEGTKTDQNFNATGYPIVKEKVTLRVLIPNSVDHPKDMIAPV